MPAAERPIDPWANPNLLLRIIPASEPLARPRRKARFLRPDPARYAADRKAATGAEFVTLCYRHGLTLFDTARGGCLLCEQSLAEAGLPAVRLAEAIGADHYDGSCSTHGAALFHTGTERCGRCTAGLVGRPRQLGNARAVARREGATTYLAACEVHGETAHSTARGKCLSCFNSLGQPRKRPAAA